MPLDLTRIQALCFDVDGTLRDTDDQAVQSLSKLLKPIRFIFPEQNQESFARRIIMSSEDLGNILFGLPDRLDIDHYLARLLNVYDRIRPNKNTKPSLIIPGVKELLPRLKLHYPMAVVSAGRSKTVQAFLEQHELGSFFDCVATSQTCRRTKPYPDPILWCAEKMGVHPENCLMIGDTTVDMRAGVAAGAQTVGVLCGFGEEAELLKTGANLILATTAELLGVLNK